MGYNGDKRPENTGKKITSNTAKRMPLVFCLDATGSMLNPAGEEEAKKTRMDLLNYTVESFFEAIGTDVKARAATEVAFIVFTDKVILQSEFTNILALDESSLQTVDCYADGVNWITKTLELSNGKTQDYKVPVFSVIEEKYDNGTKISEAVVHSIDLLEDRKETLKSYGCYAPFLVLITDGNPDQREGRSIDREQNEAIQKIISHCSTNSVSNNLIIPFIVGVGDDNIETSTLKAYAGGFEDGFIHMRGDFPAEAYKLLAECICNSMNKSRKLNDNRRDTAENQISEQGKVIAKTIGKNELMKKLMQKQNPTP